MKRFRGSRDMLQFFIISVSILSICQSDDEYEWKLWRIAKCFTRNCYYFNNEITFEATLANCPPTMRSIDINTQYRNNADVLEFMKYVLGVRPDLYRAQVFVNLTCTNQDKCKWKPSDQRLMYYSWEMEGRDVSGAIFMFLKHNDTDIRMASTPRQYFPRFARFCMGPVVRTTIPLTTRGGTKKLSTESLMPVVAVLLLLWL